MKFKIKTKVVLENPHIAYNGLQSGLGYQPESKNIIKYDLLYFDIEAPKYWVFLATFASREAAKSFATAFGKNDAEEEFTV